MAESATTQPSAGASSSLTVTEVQDIIKEVNSYNEVYPNIFIGDEGFIRNKGTLQKLGVTHILNAAEGDNECQVDTGKAFYTDMGVSYMGVKGFDVKDFNMAPYFRPAADFIHTGLQARGKVAVNCHMGYSRSVCLVLAYMMLYENLSLVEAVKIVGAKRPLFPNDGFVQLLIDLEKELGPARSETSEN